MVIVETVYMPAQVGMQSLVGVNRAMPLPHKFGNYFWLSADELRVLNFWAENLNAAVEQFLTDQHVQVLRYSWSADEDPKGKAGRCCLIDDPRIPSSWYNKELCYTGFGLPPVAVGRMIYEHLGDPDNEFEQYTDPEMYHARRGWLYGRHCVSKSLPGKGPTAEQLVAELLAKRAAADV